MGDLMREEFESAMSLETGLSIELFELDRNGDSYLSTGPKYAWWAWQASRECLVVELPKPYAWDNDGGFDRESDPDSECSMALIPKIDVMQSIHAAGVKTK